MRRALLPMVVVVWALSGCALRPRYNDFVGTTHPGATQIKLQVVDRDTGKPVARTAIEFGERARYRTVADDSGTFVLPIEGRFVDENALVVVTLPGGVSGYRLVEVGGPAGAPAAPSEASGEDAGVISL